MHRRLIAIGAAASAVLALAYPQSAVADRGHGHHGGRYVQTNLVSDQPNMAAIMDPNLVNPWGMSRGLNSPIWVSDNGKDVSTLYTGAVGNTPVTPAPAPPSPPLVVSIPGGAPTGQVFNDTNETNYPNSFVVPGTGKPAVFMFAGENGDLSAWNGGTQAVAVGQPDGGVYKGLALVQSPFGPLLLAADFHNNRIDVFNSSFQRLDVAGLFTDRHLPRGYAPFNVAVIGDRVLVTYAKQDAEAHDDVAGPGNGFLDAYTTYGVFVHRVVSRGVLNSPWGLTLAPAHFGKFSNDLLVGNFGDGRIHVLDPQSGHLLGSLRDTHRKPIAIDGLWGLLVGDAAAGGPDAVWFSAGPNDESHGLLGTLTAA